MIPAIRNRRLARSRRLPDELGEQVGGLDEPTPSEIRQLMTWVKTDVVARRNARGGRSARIPA